MSCLDCSVYTCVEKVPECIDSLNIGVDINPYTSGNYIIHYEYNLNGSIVYTCQSYTLSYVNDIIVDLTARKEQFNEDNGLFKFYVTELEDPNTKLTLTVNGIESDVWGVRFYKCADFPITDYTIKPI